MHTAHTHSVPPPPPPTHPHTHAETNAQAPNPLISHVRLHLSPLTTNTHTYLVITHLPGDAAWFLGPCKRVCPCRGSTRACSRGSAAHTTQSLRGVVGGAGGGGECSDVWVVVQGEGVSAVTCGWWCSEQAEAAVGAAVRPWLQWVPTSAACVRCLRGDSILILE